MNCKIFYSWQSDLPNKTNRGFIETALEAAAKSIRNDDSIQVEPVIDRDTKDVPGSPDIAHTIFDKIEQAQVFVCDVSIINQNSSSRLTPNPNVLLELGYAINALGWNNIIMVLNSAFAKPEELPFDLRMRRVITYFMPEESEDRSTERRQLQSKLEFALRNILEGLDLQNTGEVIQPIEIGQQVRIAVENFQQNQTILLRRFMTWLRDELDKLKPDFTKGGIPDELLVQSIEQTKELIIEFAHLVEVIAMVNNLDAAREIYKQFEMILERYSLPRIFSGSYQDIDFDFYKFVGHELFVSFFSFLIRENRWELIAELLESGIYIENPSIYSRESGLVYFTYISQTVRLLDVRKNRLNLMRISLHADILNERHIHGDLANIVPMQQFMDADCFLFLRSEFQNNKANERHSWIPWTKVYMEQVPRYLVEASSIRSARKLLDPLGVKDIETFRYRLGEASNNLARMFSNGWPSSPLINFNPLTLGNKP
ncbi:hypothetical protein Ava_4263 [Trichormus variabilis ATCC 29413]|uniref:CD-NTase-associated protein 12/Pycsar effector protein TIR domain-containing protein n=2 Tax=Anabaena variabilis TaxID=264691 RepID=Q3M574_TRIV2|nr:MULTISPECIES: hypothetical protein [Nostocaceae]ABA23862.1 hypothetical protein Ava_4263 [Trichormus variabilis ATCC 29413]MBC1214458.1 hypothetical protein [Trichormus variabilis ARAD]MBC1256497.1 hypothetical protein [Trichormus variabilis V5]MBC1269952.1 hypothetical protein [Trichormus variabilis FSR]MBC1300434.1 hypothetical protein [Trichormus variabilis N2B]